MNDNFLLSVDALRLSDADHDYHTIEGALIHDHPPLVNCRGNLEAADYMRRVMMIAREYLVDYDLVRAAARAGIDWSMVRCLERDPTFIIALDMLRRELKPEEIITRAEVIEMLKREACTATKSRDRIAAAKELARIAGFTLSDEGAGVKNSAPVINITLNGGRPAEVNVTPKETDIVVVHKRKPEDML